LTNPKATRVTQLLWDLVAIPSVNPAFAGKHKEWAGEVRVIQYLTRWAKSKGLTPRKQPIGEGRHNIIIPVPAKGRAKRRILLAPHLDTVGVSSIDQLTPRIDGGRLYGRGACDTKGSVAAYLEALDRIHSNPDRPSETEIIFVGLADEEFFQAGSRYFSQHFDDEIDLAIVGEPTQSKIVTAHKGDLWLELTTEGKSAHGAQPHLGRNAIVKMAKAIEVLSNEYQQVLRDRCHPLLGSPTLNIGTIKGGSQPNIVPDHCSVEIDRRMIPGETDLSVEREIRSLMKKHGVKMGMKRLRNYPCPALDTPFDLPFVSEFSNILRQRVPRGVNYFCDGAHLSAAGIPSIVYGPGNIAQAHTNDEWISLRSLEKTADQLTMFLQGLP
jgi:acetylornithine deacetylase/succinyl-diaminopimelate desuccinylase-like protein